MNTKILVALVVVCALLISLTPVADAANIALSSVNPSVRLAGGKYPGGAGSGIVPVTGEIKDGDLNFSWNVFMGTTYVDTMGYDLGAFGTVNEVKIYQYNQGTRPRLKDVDVYTSAGKFSFTNLPDQDILSLSLPNVITSNVMVMPIAKQPTGTDPNIGISEIEVNSLTAPVARTNWAAGIVPSSTGGYNAGSMVGLTDGDLYSAAIHKLPGGSAVFDLGQQRPVGGFGLGENIWSNTREVWQNALLEFSNNGTFTDIADTRTLSLYSKVTFQQFDFMPVTARYVRVTDSGRQLVSGSEWDTNSQVLEIQLLSPAPAVPEPVTLGVLALGAVGIVLRRRA